MARQKASGSKKAAKKKAVAAKSKPAVGKPKAAVGKVKPAVGKPKPAVGKVKPAAKGKGSGKEPGRFAHPFWTKPIHTAGKNVPGAGEKMTDYVATQLQPIPKPKRNPPSMTLEDIIGTDGANAVKGAGSVTFHTFGDSGNPSTDIQEVIATAMTADFNLQNPALSPAFLFHLGDVIYYDNTDRGYQAQFYVPYKKYPGKIIAIPGNHDGELFKYDGTSTGQKTTLEAFQENFCLPGPGVPPAAGTIYREMVSQPAVYWWLDAYYVDIVALYSNIGEGPGYISGKIPGEDQKNWLKATLASIAKSRTGGGRRKGLIIASHHPPYSAGGHDSSTDMLKDIDECCEAAGLMPDAYLAGHAHTYQRFTRYPSSGSSNVGIPYYVVGTGGRKPSHVKEATGARTGNVSFDSSASCYGYLTVKASGTQLQFNFTRVDDKTGAKSSFDQTITVNY
ncbi:MAG TPA: metallophosphoesterase [Puia sp.]|nr:metallophosphoesterase [Puia sp.]